MGLVRALHKAITSAISLIRDLNGFGITFGQNRSEQ